MDIENATHDSRRHSKGSEGPDNASIFSHSQTRRQSSHTSVDLVTPEKASPSRDGERNTLLSKFLDGSNQSLCSQDYLSGLSGAGPKKQWSLARSQVSESPYHYVSSMPSKNVRDKFIDALNIWIGAPAEKVASVKEITNMLHNSSLILDDFQDDSPLRRGQPSTHTVFGSPQSINTATYMIVKAILQIQEFSGNECTAEALQMIMNLFEGQAMDLYWSFNAICPSIDDYTQMINDKTGGLFGLTRHLLTASSERPLDDNTLASLNKMVTLWGQYFQIRDDYMNLADTKYAEMKGFCEDLDEGKYSLALIHAIENNQDGYLLQNLISTRRTQGKLTRQQKMLVLDIIRNTGGFERTEAALNELHRQIITEVGSLEATFGQKNADIRVLTDLLSI
ncbi:hypothetical protein FSARC_13125 [Fusarium sarcochroum]|uniref:Uncharacterized protein n=1 Tax=Fusarium sarcochroum TaxID=1208366 RepID=A0A8H4T3I2_9HYPO|nr:hypothetical protein FSARC_13125 [Fusarium sarcochroum]